MVLFQVRFWPELRRRILPHAAAVFFFWPVASVFFAGMSLKEQPLTEDAPWKVVWLGTSLGMLRMAPEFIACGCVVLIISAALFATLRSLGDASTTPSAISVFSEALVAMFALFCGLTLEYPSLLRHPLLLPLRALSTRAAILTLLPVLLLLAAFLSRRRARPRAATFLVVILLAGLGWGLGFRGGIVPLRRARPGTTVVLGVDSLSQLEDLTVLRSTTKRLSGTWYERPVTPGLLTNAVWPAILMHRTIHETGTYLIYQAVDWSRSPFNLVHEASKSGCRTTSHFSDQFTTYVGSTAGFVEDRSGPKGWMQLATAVVKDASVFLPVVLRIIPRIPGSRTPANQSGTYAFDLRREIRSILTSGSRSGSCTFAAGHLDYLHQPLYPRFSELTRQERAVVLGAPVDSLQDLSLDWQFPTVPQDALGVYEWKLRRIQVLLKEEIELTDFLDPGKRNRLIIFSDHGNRMGLSEENFHEPRYHRVVLATFGVDARDSNRPISLLDIPNLLGFEDPDRPGPADPVVEYANGTPGEWTYLMGTAKLESDGDVILDSRIVRGIGLRLRGYRPYAPTPSQ